MTVPKEQRCERSGCWQRYQFYVELRDPHKPESMYVCQADVVHVVKWFQRLQHERGLTGDLVVTTNLLTW